MAYKKQLLITLSGWIFRLTLHILETCAREQISKAYSSHLKQKEPHMWNPEIENTEKIYKIYNQIYDKV